MRLELGLRLSVVTVVACCRAGTVLMAIVHTVSAQNLSDLSASSSELEVGLLSFMPEPEPIIRHVKKRMKREKPFANRKMNKQLSMKSPRIQMKIWCSCKGRECQCHVELSRDREFPGTIEDGLINPEVHTD